MSAAGQHNVRYRATDVASNVSPIGTSNFSITPGNIRLVDLAGRRQYEPGLMSSLCISKPDERTECWATFGAPPATTKTLAVKFYEQFDLLTGVPITD